MANGKRALVIIDQDAEIKRLDEKLSGATKAFKEKKLFLEKQAEAAYRQTVGSVWDEIGDCLVSKGILEKYDPEKDPLQIKDGVLFYRGEGKGSDRGLPEMIKGFFGLSDD